MVCKQLAFDDMVSYAQQWKSKFAEMMASGIEPPTFRLRLRLWKKNSDTTTDATGSISIYNLSVDVNVRDTGIIHEVPHYHMVVVLAMLIPVDKKYRQVSVG